MRNTRTGPSETTIKVIKTQADYEGVRREAAHLVGIDPPLGTPQADRLELLAVLLADYERKRFPLPDPDPLEAIRFRMEQTGLSRADLVPYIGSKSRVSEVLAGKRRLTLAMIRALSSGLGIPLPVLVQQARAAATPPAPAVLDWSRFPFREMAARGYLGAPRRGRAKRESVLREFLGPVQSLGPAMRATRSSHVRSDRVSNRYALLAWGARIVRRARADEPAGQYRPGTIDDAFMRHVAQLSWSYQGPLLAREFLAQHGVPLIVERHLPKTYLDGAALVLDPSHPVIGMTLRHDRLDRFWLCLLHELAHVRLHVRSEAAAFFDDLDAEGDARESEADELAREMLVPRAMWNDSPASTVRSPEAAIALARRLHVHPAVVADRMRHESRDPTILTSLRGRVRRLFPEYHGTAEV